MKEAKPLDHLGMLDEFGHRKFIIPAEVKGFYKRRKKIVHSFLLFIFLVLPWTKIGGIQSILIDIPARSFNFFGLHLRSHDAPLVFFLVTALILSLALATTLWGRVWCGWACPQTVFIEAVYRQIEIWIEGSYIQRRKNLQSPLSLKRIYQLLLKWFIYFLVSAAIAHSFLAYFVGAERLLEMMNTPPENNWVYFVIVFTATAAILFNFAWFREQFCLIMCPYGRLQSVLLDRHSVTVMYDSKRGEPRRGVSNEEQGDCVSCRRCVEVCPTGIDIRNGQQFECIGCTACIDACNEIMTKVKKPTGLISYRALTERKVKWLRSRVLIYSFLLFSSVSALAFFLSSSNHFRIELIRGKGLPYKVLSGDVSKLQNYFDLRIENDSSEAAVIQVKVKQSGISNLEILLPSVDLTIPAGEKRDWPLFMISRVEDFAASSDKKVQLEVYKDHQPISVQEVYFIGPARSE